MASEKTDHKPERVPSLIPARRPAAETSWQGNPPHKTSTGTSSSGTISLYACQFTAVISPRFGASGKRYSKTFDAAGSISNCHTTLPPNTFSTAMSSPPAPEKNDPILSP